MVEVPEDLTPKKKNIKVPMQNTPLKIGPFWAVPLEKMERWKDANWLTPSEMTLVTPSESFIHGGVWILNGMTRAHKWNLLQLTLESSQACDISWTTLLRNLKGFLYEEGKYKKLLTRTKIYVENFAVPPLYDSWRANNCERNLSFLFTGNQIWYRGNGK